MGCRCCWSGIQGTRNAAGWALLSTETCFSFSHTAGEGTLEREEGKMFKGKKIIAIGERDGIASPAIVACVQAAGSEVVLAATECFV